MEAKPSKSAKKRAYLELQALGERLVTLTEPQLAAVPLDETLREAVLDARRIKSHSALRRQRQLIGKLMRQADAEPIRAALAALDRGHQRDTTLLHLAENWRDRLVAGNDDDVDAFVAWTGIRNEALAPLLAALRKCPTDALAQRHRRAIFRQIHADLNAKMQNDSR